MLINCPDCDKLVSNMATCCPKCGCPINNDVDCINTAIDEDVKKAINNANTSSTSFNKSNNDEEKSCDEISDVQMPSKRKIDLFSNNPIQISKKALYIIGGSLLAVIIILGILLLRDRKSTIKEINTNSTSIITESVSTPSYDSSNAKNNHVSSGTTGSNSKSQKIAFSETSKNFIAILVIAYFILGLVIYHKMFVVVYFDLKSGIMKEIVGAFIFAIIMAALTFKFWPISSIILILLGLLFAAKCESSTSRIIVIAFFIVCAVITAITGIKINKNQKEKEKAAESAAVQQYEQNISVDQSTIYEQPITYEYEVNDYAINDYQFESQSPYYELQGEYHGSIYSMGIEIYEYPEPQALGIIYLFERGGEASEPSEFEFGQEDIYSFAFSDYESNIYYLYLMSDSLHLYQNDVLIDIFYKVE